MEFLKIKDEIIRNLEWEKKNWQFSNHSVSVNQEYSTVQKTQSSNRNITIRKANSFKSKNNGEKTTNIADKNMLEKEVKLLTNENFQLKAKIEILEIDL